MLRKATEKLRIIAQVCAWECPAGICRHLSIDIHEESITVFLSMGPFAKQAVIPIGHSFPMVKTSLDLIAYQVLHANDCIVAAGIDLGPFEPVLSPAIDCGGET